MNGIIAKTEKVKPEKPYERFPLFPHQSGVWAKKIRGRMHYFGPWEDWQGALDRYMKDKDDLHAGRAPKAREGEIRLHHVINGFLSFKKDQLQSGEIQQNSFADYLTTGLDLANEFGRERPIDSLTPELFAQYRVKLTKRWGLVRVNNEIQRVRTTFKWAFDSGLINTAIRWGPGFKKAKPENLEKEKNRKPQKLFSAETIRAILAAAPMPLKAMVLLGINCGFGNSDVGFLPILALDLASGWIDFPRPKNGRRRRCKLWGETVQALREWLPIRPKARNKADEGLAFITSKGNSFQEKINIEGLDEKKTRGSTSSAISSEFAKLMAKLGLKQTGVGFYALRHSFRTVADRCKDQPAIYHVMGHKIADMSCVCREFIDDDRLEAVATTVHDWLFATLTPTRAPRVTVVGAAPLPLAGPETIQEAEVVDPD